ncbi:hypothetical protein [Nostoc sp.]|uniref:hypothetical protein n=1 Tax=Nostoc sp. TaxID=1180 RepID=UPI002FF4A755
MSQRSRTVLVVDDSPEIENSIGGIYCVNRSIPIPILEEVFGSLTAKQSQF